MQWLVTPEQLFLSCLAVNIANWLCRFAVLALAALAAVLVAFSRV